jgi:hypothetical protein
VVSAGLHGRLDGKINLIAKTCEVLPVGANYLDLQLGDAGARLLLGFGTNT